MECDRLGLDRLLSDARALPEAQALGLSSRFGASLETLAWLAARQMRWEAPRTTTLRPWAALGLLLLVAQIALGGWVSTNYAALACIDLPTCHGEWVPTMDFQHGFQLLRELGHTAAGDKLSYDALTAIHWTHRVGAVVVTFYLAWLAWRAARVGGLRVIALTIAVLLAIQVSLGIGNILTGLKLAVAVAHNGGAALLLVALVVLNFALSLQSRRELHQRAGSCGRWRIRCNRRGVADPAQEHDGGQELSHEAGPRNHKAEPRRTRRTRRKTEVNPDLWEEPGRIRESAAEWRSNG